MRRKGHLALVLAAGIATTVTSIADEYESAADNSTALIEMCQKVDCLHDVRIKLKREDGSIYDQTFSSMPVVQSDAVSVYAGNVVHFEADVRGNNLVNLKLVSSIKNRDKTISAMLNQNEEGATVLAIRNPFDRDIRIQMGIMPLDQESLLRTSSCPVTAKGGSYEMWPYPVFQVWLGELRLLNEGESRACVE